MSSMKNFINQLLAALIMYVIIIMSGLGISAYTGLDATKSTLLLFMAIYCLNWAEGVVKK